VSQPTRSGTGGTAARGSICRLLNCGDGLLGQVDRGWGTGRLTLSHHHEIRSLARCTRTCPLLGVEPTLGTEPCCTGDRYTGGGGVARIVVVTFPAAGHAGRWSRSQRTSSRSGTRSSC
jgi:hypothetical protein